MNYSGTAAERFEAASSRRRKKPLLTDLMTKKLLQVSWKYKVIPVENDEEEWMMI